MTREPFHGCYRDYHLCTCVDCVLVRPIDPFVIHGAPVTKKNSGRIVRPRGLDRPVLLPSKAFTRWRSIVLPQLRIIARALGVQTPLAEPLNCAALFYRERAVGDAVNFYEALADALEDAGIVDDDKWLVSWDGSRLEKDDEDPRVEVQLTFVEEAA